METRQLMKMLGGAVIFTLIVLGITLLLPGTGKADMDSDTRNPGMDKQESVIEQKISEVSTAMKGWAVAFGSDIKKSGETTKTAFLNDVERIKQSEFVQYQRKGFEQAKVDFAKTQNGLKQLPNKLNEGTADLFATIGRGLDAILGGLSNVGKNQK